MTEIESRYLQVLERLKLLLIGHTVTVSNETTDAVQKLPGQTLQAQGCLLFVIRLIDYRLKLTPDFATLFRAIGITTARHVAPIKNR